MSDKNAKENKSARTLLKEQSNAKESNKPFANIPMDKIGAVLMSVLIVGILLTLIPEKQEVVETLAQSANAEEVVETAAKPKETDDSYDAELESRLEDILGRIEGVGDIKVMVTLESSQEKILAEEVNSSQKSTSETDSAGGSRVTQEEDSKNSIVISNSSPYIVREDMPIVSGVLVVAEGGGDVAVKNTLIQSVSSLLNIPVHKVSVFKMEAK